MDASTVTFEVPIIPNRPLKSAGEDEAFGVISLRKNRRNALIENAAFDPELMQYDADYQNNQALSASFEAHMRSVLEILKSRYPAGTKVVEVGCGKGDFIELLQADGWFEVSGFDGAYEGSNTAIEKRFLHAADKIDADLVVLRHVLEHMQRPHEFLHLLGGVFAAADIYIEVPDFAWIEANQAFFDITYEHVNYFTPESLTGLFTAVAQQGLMFGDQYQYVIASFSDSNYVAFKRAYEADDNWLELGFDAVFAKFQSAIDELAAASTGKRVYVWGAATKGVMYCHHLKRMRPAVYDRIQAAVDINPMKANGFMPAVHLPIWDVDTFCEQVGDDALVVIMNPNYADEIIAGLQARGLENLHYLKV
jgi:Methyltransferase domain/C-methyltransferase C-terminal domain